MLFVCIFLIKCIEPINFPNELKRMLRSAWHDLDTYKPARDIIVFSHFFSWFFRSAQIEKLINFQLNTNIICCQSFLFFFLFLFFSWFFFFDNSNDKNVLWLFYWSDIFILTKLKLSAIRKKRTNEMNKFISRRGEKSWENLHLLVLTHTHTSVKTKFWGKISRSKGIVRKSKFYAWRMWLTIKYQNSLHRFHPFHVFV